MSNDARQRQELADKIRKSHTRSSRKFQVATALIVSLGVVASLAALYWFQSAPESDSAAALAPAHATEDYGFEITQAVLAGDASTGESDDPASRVQVFADFLCDSCRLFHDESGAFLTEQVASGAISLTYHPAAFLTRPSADDYSGRAANAAACVADEAGLLAYVTMHELLLEHQPVGDAPAPSDTELVGFAAEAGAPDAARCIDDRTFTPWVGEATQAAIDAGVTETPTVRVDGLSVLKSQDGKTTMPGQAELEYAIGATQ